MQFFIKWASRETSVKYRIAIFILGVLLFPLLIPIFLIRIMPRLDAIIGIGSFYYGYINIVIGAILIVVGGILAFWTIILQIQIGSGSPFPMVPTKKLIITGPFAICRNPMTLGTICLYLGLSIIIRSISSIICILTFAALLLIYIKKIEEKELTNRFGFDYTQYKSRTPFIIPNIFTLEKK
jgi:protein-S-isoprenylcysteine O-methyltransferase Ste14